MKPLGRPIGVWLVIAYIATLLILFGAAGAVLRGNVLIVVVVAAAILSGALLLSLSRWAVLTTAIWVAISVWFHFFQPIPELPNLSKTTVYEIRSNIHQFAGLAMAVVIFIYTIRLWYTGVLK